MAPLVMLLAQTFMQKKAEREAEEQAREQLEVDLRRRRAAALGGGTGQIEAMNAADSISRMEGEGVPVESIMAMFDKEPESDRYTDKRGMHLYAKRPNSKHDLLNPWTRR